MISIVIPIYNGKDEIGHALEALLSQDYDGKKEIIVVDDGSVDGTAEVVKKYKGITYLPQAHQGPAVARNRGAKKAQGEIILFTDADCVPKKNWIAEMIRPFKDRNIVGVQGVYKTRQTELMARFSQIEIEERYERMGISQYIDFIGTYAAAYRKSIFDQFGGFDESFPTASGEDAEFSYRLHAAGHKMVFNPSAIVYHQHPQTLAHYLRVKFWRAYWRVLLYKKHAKKMSADSYTPQGLKVHIGLFYLFVASLFLSVVFDGFLVPVAIYVLFFIVTLPFSVKSFRKDKAVGIISPFVLQLRSLVFSLGLVEGMVKMGRQKSGSSL